MTAAELAPLQSGDFLVTSKVRGPWGCFETLQKWASGSWSGHTAMLVRDEGGALLVAESGHYNNKVGPAATSGGPGSSGEPVETQLQ